MAKDKALRILSCTVIAAITLSCLCATSSAQKKDRESFNEDKQQIYCESFETVIYDPEGQIVLSGTPVPSGKRLVIEHASVWIGMSTGSFPREIKIGEYFNPSKAVVLPASLQSSSGGYDIYVASQPIKLRLDADTKLRIDISRSSTINNATVRVYLVGYFIDYP